MAKNKKLRKGDEVTWSSHGQEVSGTVRKKITERTKAAGRTVAASKDEPQYEVESDKSGRHAVHKPESLHPKDGNA
ncbi:DUF2945 domain-containing protein [Streptomyces zagrosensis]|uniref:Hypervirulence associated protein TUDOR domain-containing protein n=1 Tax=Streptomyces zagrosensis TaxID=1042984 RepID=A0A7W9V1X6_9ACTN|nr:DUF2945 domain-containing protein [Streptomyces zagrosensis]MBB5939753.1 hypothetical protein [Streptomyces zagrosensis]